MLLCRKFDQLYMDFYYIIRVAMNDCFIVDLDTINLKHHTFYEFLLKIFLQSLYFERVEAKIIATKSRLC